MRAIYEWARFGGKAFAIKKTVESCDVASPLAPKAFSCARTSTLSQTLKESKHQSIRLCCAPRAQHAQAKVPKPQQMRQVKLRMCDSLVPV